MNGIRKLFASKKLDSRLAVLAFFRALWHLRSLFAGLLGVFAALCSLMYEFGAPVESATRIHCSFWETVYFCCVTALTIGYGDIVATSGIGRFVAVALGLLGVLATGLVTAVAVFAVQRATERVG